jgi:hypothetical protein
MSKALERKLTAYERFALATTAITLSKLPNIMQRRSNAENMLDMVAGESCGRDGPILRDAIQGLESLTGWSRERALASKPNDVAVADFTNDEKFIDFVGREYFDLLIATALKLRAVWMAERGNIAERHFEHFSESELRTFIADHVLYTSDGAMFDALEAALKELKGRFRD